MNGKIDQNSIAPRETEASDRAGFAGYQAPLFATIYPQNWIITPCQDGAEFCPPVGQLCVIVGFVSVSATEDEDGSETLLQQVDRVIRQTHESTGAVIENVSSLPARVRVGDESGIQLQYDFRRDDGHVSAVVTAVRRRTGFCSVMALGSPSGFAQYGSVYASMVAFTQFVREEAP